MSKEKRHGPIYGSLIIYESVLNFDVVCKSSSKTRSQQNLDNKRETCEYAKRHPKAKH
ncbi:75_t:CDS:1, partial [Paraglomus occultum]